MAPARTSVNSARLDEADKHHVWDVFTVAPPIGYPLTSPSLCKVAVATAHVTDEGVVPGAFG
jgi:hypothetical protein